MKNICTIIYLCIACLFCYKSNGAQGGCHISSYCKKFYDACKKINKYCDETTNNTNIPQTLKGVLHVEELHSDFDHPLHLAYLLTKWMTCVIWHQASSCKTAEPKFDGCSFYRPVYKPMMFYLLGLYARLDQQNTRDKHCNQEDSVKSVEQILAESNAHNEQDELILKNLRVLFQDNNSRIKITQDVERAVMVAIKDVLEKADVASSIEDFASVFVDYMTTPCPAL